MFKLKSNKTLEDILGGFNKTLNDLDGLIDRNTMAVLDNDKRISELQAENDAIHDETDAAINVANRLKAFLGLDS